MRHLLDTQVLIWALNRPEALSAAARRILEDSGNECFYSPVSLWEISIKYGLGKLDLLGHTPEEFHAEVVRGFLTCLPLDNRVLVSSHRLPRLHGDPFDRLLIWQAIASGCVFLSADRATDSYVPHGLSVVH